MADSRCRIEMISGIHVVAAPATIDITTTDELRRVLPDSAADGPAAVVVDMTSTRFCDFAGFSVLVWAHRPAVARGGGIRLIIPAAGPGVPALDYSPTGRCGTFERLSPWGAAREALVRRRRTHEAMPARDGFFR